MVVVADSSPFILLVNIGHIDVLPALFGQVIIPPDVAAELRRSNRPQAVQDFIQAAPPWLVERVPAVIEPIPLLHAGEVAAISLALEPKADLLLIDEVDGRRGRGRAQHSFCWLDRRAGAGGKTAVARTLGGVRSC
jgi:predicted nucleic acid-binding protein